MLERIIVSVLHKIKEHIIEAPHCAGLCICDHKCSGPYVLIKNYNQIFVCPKGTSLH